MRQYNPAYHANMIRNYRDIAKRNHIDLSKYTDEEIYRVIDFWVGVEDEEQAILEDLAGGIKRP